MNRRRSGHLGIRRAAIVTVVLFGIFFARPECAAGLPPEGIPKDARRFDGLQNERVEAWTAGSRLFLIPMKLTSDDKEGIQIPRLANMVKEIHFQPDAGQPIQLHPEPDHWLIKVGDLTDDMPEIIVLELNEPAMIFDDAIISEPDRQNIITLPARSAITHGSTLRYEPQAHKNTVGYWADVKDTAEWQLKVLQPGAYDVDVLQGCGKGHGGSKVDLLVADQTLTFEVQETGHFQNFIWRTVGTVNLVLSNKGRLSLVPVHKVAGAVMDVRSIRLVPTGTKRSFESELADPEALPKPI